MSSSAPTRLPHAVDAARYRIYGRLLESLLHDVRNPLNALSINLEVLMERARTAAGGELPANQEKHFTAIRAQVQRVDGILRSFAEFMAPASVPRGLVSFSAVVSRAIELLGHESRRARVQIEADVEPDLNVSLPDPALAPFLALPPILRAIERSEGGGRVQVRWLRRGRDGVLEVRGGGGGAESREDLLEGLEEASRLQNVKLSAQPDALTLVIPLAVSAAGTEP